MRKIIVTGLLAIASLFIAVSAYAESPTRLLETCPSSQNGKGSVVCAAKATATNTVEVLRSTDGALHVSVASGASGTVEFVPDTTFESACYTVPATSASGTNMDPSFLSDRFVLTNQSTSTTYLLFDGNVPNQGYGIPIAASAASGTVGGILVLENIAYNSFEIYNPGGATAVHCVTHMQK